MIDVLIAVVGGHGVRSIGHNATWTTSTAVSGRTPWTTAPGVSSSSVWVTGTAIGAVCRIDRVRLTARERSPSDCRDLMQGRVADASFRMHPARHAPTMESLATASSRFITEARVEEIAELACPLLLEGMNWVERRKESISILDETALRRQISVEMSLRSTTRPLLRADRGEGSTTAPDQEGHLFCAPLFVLPKAPASLMAFDLIDEQGTSLRLISRDDNAAISGAVFERMAEAVLGHVASPDLRARLKQIGRSEETLGTWLAEGLLSTDGSTDDDIVALRSHERFAWWTRTLAHSSLVVVLFRAAGPGRKLVKLSFEQALAQELPRRALLGWDPYKVWIDSPLIDARTYHLEVSAPSGIQIVEASHTIDGSDDPVTRGGSVKRMHLYRSQAENAGAGTAILLLRITQGLFGGALIAAFAATLALVACFSSVAAIAESPASAPALLLILPGLIATYVARPDQHGLTTRLLGYARRLVILSAFTAYAGAGRVALGGLAAKGGAVDARADNLRLWFGGLTLLSLLPLAGLAVGFVRQRTQGSSWSSPSIPIEAYFMASSIDHLTAILLDASADAPMSCAGYEPTDVVEGGVVEGIRPGVIGSWVLSLTVTPIQRDVVRLTGYATYVSKTAGWRPTRSVREHESQRLQRLVTSVTEKL